MLLPPSGQNIGTKNQVYKIQRVEDAKNKQTNKNETKKKLSQLNCRNWQALPSRKEVRG